MTAEVFVDSGAFIALLDRSDGRHADAHALFAAPPRRWCTSVLVVAETYGWMLRRLGEEAARAFEALVDELPKLAVLPVDGAHRQAVRRTLDTLRGRKLTYVDASSLTFMTERRIETAWATDWHLGLTGATVVPGPRPP